MELNRVIEAQVTGKAQAKDEVTAVCTGNSGTAAGEYTAKVTGLTGAAAGNYTVSENEATAAQNWKINKAANSFTIAPSISDWTEGKTAAAPIAAAKYGTVVFTYASSQNGLYTSAVPTAQGEYYLKAAVAGGANYGELEATKSFKINARDDTIKTITIKAKNVSVTYGDPVPSFTEDSYTVTGLADSETLDSVTTGSATISTDYTQGSSAGTYQLVPGGLTAKDGYEINYKPGRLTVNKKSVSLNWSAVSFVYSGAVQSVTAAVNSGNLYTGDSISVTGYEYNAASKICNTATDAGTYTAHAISFTGKNAGNYVIRDDSTSHSWSITKAVAGGETANSFTVQPAVTGWTYGETAHDPVGAAKYGTLVYTYSNAADGTYTTERPQNAGTWYMKATAPATDNYDEISTATPVEFTISKAQISIVADDVSSAYGAPLAKLTYVMNGTVKAGDDLGIKLSTTATGTSKKGDYPISVTYTANANYDVRTTDGTYSVTASTSKLSVTASGIDSIYDGAAHGISVTVKDANGNAVTDADIYYSETELNSGNYGSGSKESPTLADVGKKTVYYYVASDKYEPVSGSKDIVISQKAVRVTANNASITYGDAPVNKGVTYSGFAGKDTAETLGLSPQYDVAYTQYGDAGTYNITPKGLETSGNYIYYYTSGKLTVAQKPVTFTWSQKSFVYDGTERKVTATVKGTVNSDDVTVGTYTDNRKTAVGSYTAAVTALAGAKASSYVINDGETTASHAWSITSGTNYFTRTPEIADWMYGNTAAQPLGTAAYGTVKFQYSDVQNGIYTDTKPSKPGTYYMKARVDGTADYPVLVSGPVGFKITKCEVSVIADDITGKTGEAVKELTYTKTGSTVSGDQFDVSLSTTASSNSAAGDYPVTVSVAYDDTLYDVTKTDGTYHITDLDITISADGVNVPYDGKAHGISVNAVSGGAAQTVYYSETKITDTSNLASNSNARTASPTRNHPCSLQVYYYVVCGTDVFGGSKMLTITKAPLTVTAKDAVINQGEEPKNNGVSYSGLAAGDTEQSLNGAVQYSYTYSKGMADGSYEIRPSGLSSIDYDITYKPGMLTVNPVQQETAISGTGAESGVYDAKPHKGYSGTPVALGGDMTEKDFTIVYKDTDTGNTISGAPTDAGKYSVTISVPASDKHYKGSVSYDFTIAKKAVIIKAQDQSMIAGQTFSPMDPVYSGFEGSDDVSSAVKTRATVELASGADTSKAGSVAINVTGNGEFTDAAAKNYEFGTVEGAKLTVLAKAPGGKGGDGTGSVGVDSGSVQTAVIEDSGLPKTELEPDLTADTAKKLLSTEEIDQVKNGKDALIYLKMSNAGDEDADDIDKINEKAADLDSGMVIGRYFDLSMFKKVGDSPDVKISVTGTDTTIKITLPDDLKSDDPTITRTYYIVYVHDGVSKVIYPAYADGVLTFEASEFSTYSVVYKDTVKPSGGGGSQGGTSPSTGGGNGGSGSGSNTDTETVSTDKAKTPKTPAPAVTPAETPSQPAAVPAAGKGSGKGKESNNNNKNTAADESTAPASSGDGNGKKSDSKDKADNAAKDTPAGKTVKDVPKETGRQLADALEKIKDLDPDIKEGPYIQVTSGESSSQNGTKVTFTVPVPKDLQAKNRTFYLVGVDKKGNVVVIKNESLDGKSLTFKGDPDMTYQLVYEDGGAKLDDHIGNDGRLVTKDGSAVTVSTSHCFWHWMILILAVLGAALEYLFRKKKKAAVAVMPADICLMIICCMLGWCHWDIIAAVIGALAVAGSFAYLQRREERQTAE
jgi:hypothetical protein